MHPDLDCADQIRADEIDYVRARNATMQDQTVNLQRLVDLIKNRNLLVFAAGMVLFHFSNASLLPLVSQNLAHSKDTLGPLFMAGLIIVPQIGVAILAPWIGYWSELWGRKPLLLAGFAAQIARALIFSMVSDPWMMIAVQVLDGITGAAVTVLTILVLTDLTTGTGRFNLAQGILGTLMGIAVALGTSTIEFTVERYGDVTGFVVMAAGRAWPWSCYGLCCPRPSPRNISIDALFRCARWATPASRPARLPSAAALNAHPGRVRLDAFRNFDRAHTRKDIGGDVPGHIWVIGVSG